MLYCRKCKVHISGNKKCCPLCQSNLQNTENPTESPFPTVKATKYSRLYLLRLISFVAISAIVICFAINMMTTELLWALPAGAGIACLWINATLGIVWRKNIFKNITIQLFFISVFCVLWDLFTGWHGWSIDYVLPCGCIISIISMPLITKIMSVHINEYIIYLILNAFYGIVPILSITLGWLNVVYPSVICSACGIISIAALMLFKGKEVIFEIKKSFHI